MDKPLHVVSVNIEEIYSGYTFSSAKDFEYDPMHIASYGGWTSLYCEGSYLQTPTSILLNAEKGFESFGYEAEDQYMSLSENVNESDVYFFQHFLCQPKWYKETVNGEILVKSSNLMGPIPLKTLLSHSVRYLKTHHLKQTQILRDFKKNEILYVVVYPDEIKFDVRFLLLESFLNTGISQANIVLVGESYAIQTFARHIEKPKIEEYNGAPKESSIILNCTLTQVCPKVAFYDYPMVTTSVIGTSSIINDIESILTKRVGCSLFSDPIRSSKIAGKLQDLYEVEYAESLAFGLEKGCDESTSEEFLLQILNEAYDEYRTQACVQINAITQALHPTVGIDDINTSLPSDVVKPLIEYRRKNALQYLPRLIKSFVETLPNKINISNAQLSVCTSFIEKSMECCWLMCITEPPMFLKFEWNKSEQIALDELEVEGGDGKYVDSMRWPTLYLYENGPLMNKGVVNAK
ncbi:unnamed protein product [Mytilus coruscus]|uniref:Mitochondria-eating protein C-terminal domain-containing protein n=1 Tax=Mytilus coruscus TaxID=42192 RepID=A0A6J8CGV4_MYTCO|nr:unnamed protein product [Mytilus coruscus]